MAPPKKNKTEAEVKAENAAAFEKVNGPLDPIAPAGALTAAGAATPEMGSRAGTSAASSPQAVIVEARLASHVASALPAFGSQTVLRLAGAKAGAAGMPWGGKVVDSMKLTPRGLEVVTGKERIIIGAGSWVALIEAER